MAATVIVAIIAAVIALYSMNRANSAKNVGPVLFLTIYLILFWRHSSTKEHDPGHSRLSSTMGGQDEEACIDTVGRSVSFRGCRHRLGTVLLWWRLLLWSPVLW
jgi:hypothetical protein